MYGLGCDCDRAGLGDANTLDFSGTLWASAPNQYPQLAGMSTDVGGVSAGNTWSDVWKKVAIAGTNTGLVIANARYGGVQPGQYMQAGSNIAYRVPTGSTNFGTFPSGVGVGIGSGGLLTYLLIGGVALVAIKALSSR